MLQAGRALQRPHQQSVRALPAARECALPRKARQVAAGADPSTAFAKSVHRDLSMGVKILVLAGPNSPELSVLQKLPPGSEVVGVGRSRNELSRLSEDQLADVDVLVICGVGANAAKKADVQAIWPLLKGLKWIYSSSAGLEGLLFPELVESPVILTNSRGVYSNSLAEYALTTCNWFAKDVPRLLRAKAEKKWDQYEVEELRGKTMGVVGYGDIGQACARLARAFKMRVVGLRRRAELSAKEQQEGLVDAMYTPDQLPQLMSISDYVVMSTPYTPQTDKLVNAEAIAATKPNAVFINVGRGKCVDEKALIQALKTGRIRGAGLDVFETEPLPADNELWELPNVFMSAHTADRTKEFQIESLEFFVSNVERWVKSEPLQNVVDKKLGY